MRRLAVLASHPIQTLSPWLRALAERVDLRVFYRERPDPRTQGRSFGVVFTWDVDLLTGYRSQFGLGDLYRGIASGAFDAVLVCGWGRREYWAAVLACRKAGVLVLVRGDGQLQTQRPVWKRAIKAVAWPAMLRAFDGYLIVGSRMQEYLRRYRVPAERCFASPHCVDNARFAAAARKARGGLADLRARWGIAAQTPVALFVGKLLAGKRAMDLLWACDRLRRQGRAVHGVIVGDGPERERLAAAADDLPITFTGFSNQADLPAWYALADVLVVPSESESWGLVVNESMACGTPVVVSDAVACGPDLVTRGVTGEVVPVGDVETLAGAIGAVLARGKGGAVATGIGRKMALYAPGPAADGVRLALEALVSE